MVERDKVRSSWGKKDILLLVSIFYLLGIVTSIIIYIVVMGGTEAKGKSKEIYSELYVSDVHIRHNFAKEEGEKSTNDVLPHNLFEATTVLRSAIYQYVKQNGFMPPDFSPLVQPFPQNYLSAIPRESITFSNEVSPIYTGEGGWVYQPEDARFESEDEEQIKKAIERAVFPNVDKDLVGAIPFEPLHILIDKGNNQLLLASGGNILKKYPVALGKNATTPEGGYSVSEKVMNPNSHTYPIESNPYGKRALAISDIAIHGTNEPHSIGENVSLGCIRMNNEDIIEIYSIVPLHTTIQIYSSSNEWGDLSDQSNLYFKDATDFIFSQEDNQKEENHTKVYNWSG